MVARPKMKDSSPERGRTTDPDRIPVVPVGSVRHGTKVDLREGPILRNGHHTNGVPSKRLEGAPRYWVRSRGW